MLSSIPDNNGVWRTNQTDIIRKQQQGYCSQVAILITTIKHGIVQPDAELVIVQFAYNEMGIVEQYAAANIAVVSKMPHCYTWRGYMQVVNPDDTVRTIAEYPVTNGAGYNKDTLNLN